MNEEEFEEKLNIFWDTNDEWLSQRLQAIADSDSAVDEQALAEAETNVEETLSGMIAQAVQAHGSFSRKFLMTCIICSLSLSSRICMLTPALRSTNIKTMLRWRSRLLTANSRPTTPRW